MSKAIITKYMGATDTRGSRIQCKCDGYKTKYFDYYSASDAGKAESAAGDAHSGAVRLYLDYLNAEHRSGGVQSERVWQRVPNARAELSSGMVQIIDFTF